MLLTQGPLTSLLTLAAPDLEFAWSSSTPKTKYLSYQDLVEPHVDKLPSFTLFNTHGWQLPQREAKCNFSSAQLAQQAPGKCRCGWEKKKTFTKVSGGGGLSAGGLAGVAREGNPIVVVRLCLWVERRIPS